MSILSGIFGKFGSAPFWRDRYAQTVDSLRLAVEPANPKILFENLPDMILIEVVDAPEPLRVRSAVPSVDFRWEGPLAPQAEIFRFFTCFETKLEREKFLDYVYNFKAVVMNMKNFTFWAVEPSLVEDLGLTTNLPDASLYQEAFS